MEQRTTYQYMPDDRRKRNLVRGLVLVVFGIVPIALAINSAFIPRSLLWVLLFLPLVAVSIVVNTAILVTTADISVDIKHIRIHLLGPLTITIPMQSATIMLIEEWPTPIHIRLITRTKWDKVKTVSIAGHDLLKLVGLYYGIGPVPIFILTPDHEKRDQLIKRIEHAKHPLKRKKPGHTLYRKKN